MSAYTSWPVVCREGGVAEAGRPRPDIRARERTRRSTGQVAGSWPVFIGLSSPLWPPCGGFYLYAFDTPYSAWDGVNPSDLSWPTRPDSENDVYSR